MGELINGRTPEEIKTALELCNMISNRKNICESCPYNGECTPEGKPDQPGWDALVYIQRLESERDAALAKVPKWISVEEYLPENEECVFVTVLHDGYFGKPRRIVMTAFHTDGKTIAGESGYNWSEGSVEMEYDEEADDFIVPEGWWEDVQCGDEFSKVEYKVTHWMPLPEPPKEGEL